MSSPFAHAHDGAVIAVADGPEVLVWSGTSDAPLWKRFLNDAIVGVGTNVQAVFALTSAGRLYVWRAADGLELHELDTRVPSPTHLAVSADGGAAAIAPAGAAVTDGRQVLFALAVPDATCAAYGGGRTALAVGDANGGVHVWEATTGVLRGVAPVGAPVRSIAWRPQGQWVVAAGRSVHLVAADGAAVVQAIDVGADVGAVSVSAEGALVSVVCGTEVAIVELAGFKRIGQVRFDRAVDGAGFGAGTQLAIAVDGGEVCRADLLTGQTRRSEPHPGRVAQRWGFRLEADPFVVRQSVTAVRTGGAAVAVQVARPWEEAGGGDGGGMSCLKMLLITLAIVFVCSGCAGVGTFAYYYFYVGL